MSRPPIPRDPFERTVSVQAQLRVKGSSFAQIARRIGMSRRTIANAMYAPNYRAEIAIAEELGLRVEVLFPERFTAAGDRIPIVRHRKSSDGASTRNVEDQEAA